MGHVALAVFKFIRCHSELVSQWVCNLNAIGLREKRVGIKDMGAIDKSEVPCTLIGPINFQ